jgi:hypothetical protein
VAVAVSANAIADAFQDQGLIAKRLKRLQAFLQREDVALVIGPERVGYDAVGAEHDDQPLLASRLIRKREARQVHDERRHRRSHAQLP